MRRGGKSLDPDGYNIKVIKEFWHLLKDDFCNVLKEFHERGILQKWVIPHSLP